MLQKKQSSAFGSEKQNFIALQTGENNSLLKSKDVPLALFRLLTQHGRKAIIGEMSQQTSLVQAVTSVGITVSDMEEAIRFYTDVLDFQKISDVEVFGRPYELLQGVFGLRMRVVEMQLGQERIELTQYLTPQGRPIPVDSRSNDLWFQHIAIVVRDMDAAYEKLRRFQVEHVSTGPQRLPEYIPAAAGIEAFYFRDPDGNYVGADLLSP